MENITIYDANLRVQGAMERKEAHKIGAWHKTFHCWIVNPINSSILFQLRAKDKKNYPDMFDISAAGHLIVGEKVEHGIRELSEELGINIAFDDLYSLGYRVEVDDQDNGQKNREYQAVYMASINQNLGDYKPQVEEVAGLMWMTIADALDLFSHNVDNVYMSGIVFNNEKNVWENSRREVSINDFIPRIQQYYLTISIMADRFLKNEFPISIS